MNKMKLLPIAVGALLLAGCSGPSAGTIHDKRYEEGYYYTTMQCASYNAQGVCTVNIPIQHYSEPSWAFDIYASQDDHGWKHVSEATYNNYDIGDYYSEESNK